MKGTAHKLSSSSGFSLLELMLVVAIIGVLAAFAVPFTVRYQTKEHARSHAERVMAVLQAARESAVATGQPTWVLFDDPDNPSGSDPALTNGMFAMIARDTDMDNDFTVDGDGDLRQAFAIGGDLMPGVSGYGLPGPGPFPNAPLPPQDPASATVPSLGSITTATTLPIDPGTGLPGVAFTSQGLAVSIGPTAPSTTPPGDPGSGTGAYYVTDNDQTVYAVIIQPLGNVLVRKFDGVSGTWQ